MYPGGENYTGKEMPPWMAFMANHIRLKTGQPINHAIIIKYDSGTKTHAPPHQDKVPKDTSFFVFSYGKPRRFDVLDTKIVESEDEKKRDSSGNPVKKYNPEYNKDGTGTVKTKLAPSTVCWSKELEHSSLSGTNSPVRESTVACDLCRERTTPVRKRRAHGRSSVRRGEAAEHGCHKSTHSPTIETIEKRINPVTQI
jgi:hypothetical protein